MSVGWLTVELRDGIYYAAHEGRLLTYPEAVDEVAVHGASVDGDLLVACVVIPDEER